MNSSNIAVDTLHKGSKHCPHDKQHERITCNKVKGWLPCSLYSAQVLGATCTQKSEHGYKQHGCRSMTFLDAWQAKLLSPQSFPSSGHRWNMTLNNCCIPYLMY